tara:strand:+ start:66 stop:173 length:108 start_codon:yes stop_codon:yes gene_type:complete
MFTKKHSRISKEKDSKKSNENAGCEGIKKKHKKKA